MSKQAAPKLLFFGIFAVPWAFLLALCDRLPVFPFWPVFLAVLLGLGAMAWFCGKNRLVSWAVTGNVVSCLLSVVLVIRRFGVSDYYFSPFRPVDFMLFLSALLLSVQITLWRIQRKTAAPSLIAQFIETLAILFFSAIALIFLLLWVSQLSL